MRGSGAASGVGVGVLAVVCCAALPAVAAFAGGLQMVAWLRDHLDEFGEELG